MRASTDGGVSWDAPAADLVSNSTWTNAGGAVYDKVAGALFASYTTNGPCIACDWSRLGANCTQGCRNVWMRKSTDGAVSWGPPQNVSGAIWPMSGAGSSTSIGEFVCVPLACLACLGSCSTS